MKANKGSKKVLKEYDDYEDSDAPIDYSKEWPVGKELMIVAPSDGEQPHVVEIDSKNPFPTKLGPYESYVAKVKVLEIVGNSEEGAEEETDERLAEMRSVKMKLTKSLLRKLVREEVTLNLKEFRGVEPEDEPEDEPEEESEDFITKFQDRLDELGDDTGQGSWDKRNNIWEWDDMEGGYYSEVDVKFLGDNKVSVSGEPFHFKSMDDVEEAVDHVKSVGGLYDRSGYGGHKGSEDSDEESEEETDERLAEMRKIRQGFRKLLK